MLDCKIPVRGPGPDIKGPLGSPGRETICLPRTFYIVMHPESRVLRTMFHL